MKAENSDIDCQQILLVFFSTWQKYFFTNYLLNFQALSSATKYSTNILSLNKL